MKKTFSSDVSVVCRDLSVKKFLVQYALSKGVPVFNVTRADIIEGIPTYPNLTFSSDEICGTYSGSENKSKTWISVDEFMDYCDNWEECQPKPIQLTNDYDAKIDKARKVVRVGCQTISYEVIDALYKEMYK